MYRPNEQRTLSSGYVYGLYALVKTLDSRDFERKFILCFTSAD